MQTFPITVVLIGALLITGLHFLQADTVAFSTGRTGDAPHGIGFASERPVQHDQLSHAPVNSNSDPEEGLSVAVTLKRDLIAAKPYVNYQAPELYFNEDLSYQVIFKNPQEVSTASASYSTRANSLESSETRANAACEEEVTCLTPRQTSALRRIDTVLTSHAIRAEPAFSEQGTEDYLSKGFVEQQSTDIVSSFETTLAEPSIMRDSDNVTLAKSSPDTTCREGCEKNELTAEDRTSIVSSERTLMSSYPVLQSESPLETTSAEIETALAVAVIGDNLKTGFEPQREQTASREAPSVRPKPRPEMQSDDRNSIVDRVTQIDNVFASFDLPRSTGGLGVSDGGSRRAGFGSRSNFALVGVFSDGAKQWALIKDRSGRMHRVEAANKLGSVLVMHVNSGGISITVDGQVKRVSVGSEF